MKSIRARLLAGLLALVALTAIGAGVITYERMLDETSGLFDYQLRQMALSLRDQATIGPGLILPSHPYGSDFVIQIWSPLGALSYASRPGLPVINRAILGYADMRLAGERWRVYSLETADGVIQVAQPWRVREELASEAALRVLAPLLLLLTTMAAAVIWIVARGLAPLRRLASEVERRDAHSLAPIGAGGFPAEAAPLVEELNSLLARLADAFGKQRAFVADAAHELRSPLTALSLQLQLLDRAPDEAARAQARAKLGAAVERAIHLATQLLTLARHEPEGAAVQLRTVELESVVREAIAETNALAAARGIELALETAGVLHVRGDADALRILVRNLVDNAVRYAPAGGKVEVRLRTCAAGSGTALPGAARSVELSVADNGPGIPASERERAFDRFFRRPGSAEGGTGLGLAIVKAIAERHGARVSLEDAHPSGLRVTVLFPSLSS
ncbi:MAG TPA: ATP-binding protein [Steroidobacteraceae bacterium]|nr:ATP-binding protein [Steroidobacteraceae bacterium]